MSDDNNRPPGRLGLDLEEPAADTVSRGEHDLVVAELERVRTQPKGPTHEAVKRGFYNGRSGWARHFGLACEDLDHLDHQISDLATVPNETRDLMRRELACVRTHMIDAYDEVTTGVTETERRLWGSRQSRPKHAETRERVVMSHMRRKLTASDDEKAEWCLICGHEPCGGCGDWCDSIVTDSDGEMTLCCSGGCTYTDEELQRKLVEDPEGFVSAVRDSATYARAMDEDDQQSARIDDMLGEAVIIAELGHVPGPETIQAWRDEIDVESDDQGDEDDDDDGGGGVCTRQGDDDGEASS